MNNYKRAKEWINSLEDGWSRVDIDWEAVDEIRELVDKATPMKVEEPLRLEQGLCGECPHCTAFVQNRNYCGHCGQALDWSEDE